MKISLSKNNIRQIIFIGISLTTIFLACLLGASTFFEWRSRIEQTTNRAIKSGNITNTMVSNNIGRIESLLIQIADDIKIGKQMKVIIDETGKRVFAHPTLKNVLVLDDKGTVIASTDQVFLQNNFSNKDFFSAFFKSPRPKIIISRAMYLNDSRFPEFVTAIPIITDDKFNGVVLAIHDPKPTNRILSNLIDDSNDSILIIRFDGIVIGSVPLNVEILGKNAADTFNFKFTEANPSESTIPTHISIYGYEETAAVSRNEHLGFYVISSKSVDAAMTDWQNIYRIHIFIGACLITFPIIAFVILWWQSERIKKRDKEIEHRDEELRAIFECASDSFIRINTDGNIIDLNHSAERLFNLGNSSAILGMNIFDIIPDLSNPAVLAQTVEQQINIQTQIPHTKTPTFVEISTTIIECSGELTYLLVIRNISDRIDLIEKLSQEKHKAEMANWTKTNFLANVSHELRTPLNTIIGFSEILTSQQIGTLCEKQKEYVESILNASIDLLDIINDILDLATIESGEYLRSVEPFDIHVAIQSAINTFQTCNDRQTNISVDNKSKITNILGDIRAFQQIITNLISNSTKYGKDNGNIQIITFLDNNKNFVIESTDDGRGMTEEQLNNIKASIVGNIRRVSAMGHGFGIPLICALTKLHGGKIEIFSEIGKGTTIQLIFSPGIYETPQE